MRRFILPVAAILLTAACSSTTDHAAPEAPVHQPMQSAPASMDASAVFKALAAQVPTAKLTGVVTAENDPNSLLGRPNEYTSKITFSDSQVPAADVKFTKAGDVDLGGGIEVFGSPDDAAARAKYIAAIVKSMPMFSEYDYVHGDVLVRVSHYLTPDQAAKYKAALDKIG